ncbi:MAG: hypothetical protein ACMUIE_02420 [Thermoplasmatota archaeon]
MKAAKTKDIDDTLLRPGTQIYLKTSGEAYLKTFSELVTRLAKEQGRRGILVSTLWSANALSRRLSLSKLPRGSLKVIDTISLSMGSKVSQGEGFAFLSTPVSLESILMEIERTLSTQGPGHNFLVFDSLTFLSKYYTAGQLSEFFHFIFNRMLEESITVVIFDNEEESSRISKELIPVMDHSIDIGEGGGKK